MTTNAKGLHYSQHDPVANKPRENENESLWRQRVENQPKLNDQGDLTQDCDMCRIWRNTVTGHLFNSTEDGKKVSLKSPIKGNKLLGIGVPNGPYEERKELKGYQLIKYCQWLRDQIYPATGGQHAERLCPALSDQGRWKLDGMTEDEFLDRWVHECKTQKNYEYNQSEYKDYQYTNPWTGRPITKTGKVFDTVMQTYIINGGSMHKFLEKAGSEIQNYDEDDRGNRIWHPDFILVSDTFRKNVEILNTKKGKELIPNVVEVVEPKNLLSPKGQAKIDLANKPYDCEERSRKDDASREKRTKRKSGNNSRQSQSDEDDEPAVEIGVAQLSAENTAEATKTPDNNGKNARGTPRRSPRNQNQKEIKKQDVAIKDKPKKDAISKNIKNDKMVEKIKNKIQKKDLDPKSHVGESICADWIDEYITYGLISRVDPLSGAKKKPKLHPIEKKSLLIDKACGASTKDSTRFRLSTIHKCDTFKGDVSTDPITHRPLSEKRQGLWRDFCEDVEDLTKVSGPDPAKEYENNQKKQRSEKGKSPPKNDNSTPKKRKNLPKKQVETTTELTAQVTEPNTPDTSTSELTEQVTGLNTPKLTEHRTVPKTPELTEQVIGPNTPKQYEPNDNDNGNDDDFVHDVTDNDQPDLTTTTTVSPKHNERNGNDFGPNANFSNNNIPNSDTQNVITSRKYVGEINLVSLVEKINMDFSPINFYENNSRLIILKRMINIILCYQIFKFFDKMLIGADLIEKLKNHITTAEKQYTLAFLWKEYCFAANIIHNKEYAIKIDYHDTPSIIQSELFHIIRMVALLFVDINYQTEKHGAHLLYFIVKNNSIEEKSYMSKRKNTEYNDVLTYYSATRSTDNFKQFLENELEYLPNTFDLIVDIAINGKAPTEPTYDTKNESLVSNFCWQNYTNPKNRTKAIFIFDSELTKLRANCIKFLNSSSILTYNEITSQSLAVSFLANRLATITETRLIYVDYDKSITQYIPQCTDVVSCFVSYKPDDDTEKNKLFWIDPKFLKSKLDPRDHKDWYNAKGTFRRNFKRAIESTAYLAGSGKSANIDYEDGGNNQTIQQIAFISLLPLSDTDSTGSPLSPLLVSDSEATETDSPTILEPVVTSSSSQLHTKVIDLEAPTIKDICDLENEKAWSNVHQSLIKTWFENRKDNIKIKTKRPEVWFNANEVKNDTVHDVALKLQNQETGLFNIFPNGNIKYPQFIRLNDMFEAYAWDCQKKFTNQRNEFSETSVTSQYSTTFEIKNKKKKLYLYHYDRLITFWIDPELTIGYYASRKRAVWDQAWFEQQRDNLKQYGNTLSENSSFLDVVNAEPICPFVPRVENSRRHLLESVKVFTSNIVQTELILEGWFGYWNISVLSDNQIYYKRNIGNIYQLKDRNQEIITIKQNVEDITIETISLEDFDKILTETIRKEIYIPQRVERKNIKQTFGTLPEEQTVQLLDYMQEHRPLNDVDVNGLHQITDYFFEKTYVKLEVDVINLILDGVLNQAENETFSDPQEHGNVSYSNVILGSQVFLEFAKEISGKTETISYGPRGAGRSWIPFNQSLNAVGCFKRMKEILQPIFNAFESGKNAILNIYYPFNYPEYHWVAIFVKLEAKIHGTEVELIFNDYLLDSYNTGEVNTMFKSALVSLRYNIENNWRKLCDSFTPPKNYTLKSVVENNFIVKIIQQGANNTCGWWAVNYFFDIFNVQSRQEIRDNISTIDAVRESITEKYQGNIIVDNADVEDILQGRLDRMYQFLLISMNHYGYPKTGEINVQNMGTMSGEFNPTTTRKSRTTTPAETKEPTAAATKETKKSPKTPAAPTKGTTKSPKVPPKPPAAPTAAATKGTTKSPKVPPKPPAAPTKATTKSPKTTAAKK